MHGEPSDVLDPIGDGWFENDYPLTCSGGEVHLIQKQ
jgi:hypothetical protein